MLTPAAITAAVRTLLVVDFVVRMGRCVTIAVA